MNSKPMREHSNVQVLINNVPYIGMIVMGAAILVLGLDESAWMWIAGVAYLTYGLVGTFWIILFICPYCNYWNTTFCPCGYGLIAAKLRERKPGNRFNEKFKKHIPVIVPLWFIPVLAGVPLVIRTFSWPLLVLLVVFAIDAFVILPLFSRKHGCKECPQKDTCPWMGRKSEPAST